MPGYSDLGQPAAAGADLLPLGSHADLLSRTFTSLQLGSIPVLVVSHQGRLSAFVNRCSHQERPMLTPTLEEGSIVCDHHSAAFSARDGRVTDSMGWYRLAPLTVLSLHVDGDAVSIRLPKPQSVIG